MIDVTHESIISLLLLPPSFKGRLVTPDIVIKSINNSSVIIIFLFLRQKKKQKRLENARRRG